MNHNIDELAELIAEEGYSIVELGPESYLVLDTGTHVRGTIFDAVRALSPDELMRVCADILLRGASPAPLQAHDFPLLEDLPD